MVRMKADGLLTVSVVVGLLLGAGQADAPRSFSYPAPPTYTLGSAVAPLSPTVTGRVTGYSVSPPLPAGITLDAVSGHIAGTPGVTSATADYRVTASNSAGSTSCTLALTVNNTLPFWLEPSLSTVIGVGQEISVFPALKANVSAPYPVYVDPGLVAWSSSDPACATVSDQGAVVGVSSCSTVITGKYQTHTSQLTVQVSGAWENHLVNVDGQGTRAYAVYIPETGGDAGALPAILSLHGGGGSPMMQAATSQLVKLAHQQKTALAFLEGSGPIQTFNAGACCGYAKDNAVDDVRYVNAVLDDMAVAGIVDMARVYATGFSNGGMMSHRLACAAADRIAGIAAVGGGSGEFDQDANHYYTCSPTRPLPVLHIHATNDRNYPYEGGPGDGLSPTHYYSIDSTIADWRARNNVTAQATEERVTATTTCYHYAVAAQLSLPSARVTLCKVDPLDVFDEENEIVFGGGHSWPGGVRSISPTSDSPVMDFVANDYIWKFFNP